MSPEPEEPAGVAQRGRCQRAAGPALHRGQESPAHPGLETAARALQPGGGPAAGGGDDSPTRGLFPESKPAVCPGLRPVCAPRSIKVSVSIKKKKKKILVLWSLSALSFYYTINSEATQEPPLSFDYRK